MTDRHDPGPEGSPAPERDTGSGRLFRADVLRRAGRVAQARAELSGGDLDLAAPEVQAALGTLHLVEEDPTGAIAFLERARAQDPAWQRLNPTTVLGALAEAFTALERWQEVLTAVDSAFEADPWDLRTLDLGLVASVRLGRGHGLRRRVRTVSSEHEQAVRGLVEAATQRWRAAVTALCAAAERLAPGTPGRAHVITRLLGVLEQLGDWDAMRRIAEVERLTRVPTDPPDDLARVDRALVVATAELGDDQRADELAEQFAGEPADVLLREVAGVPVGEPVGEPGTAAVQVLRAWTRGRLRDDEAEARFLRAALALDPYGVTVNATAARGRLAALEGNTPER